MKEGNTTFYREKARERDRQTEGAVLKMAEGMEVLGRREASGKTKKNV